MTTTNDLTWQEADAIAVLRLRNSSLRPGHKVGAQQILSHSIKAQLKHTDVFDGIQSLAAKGDLVISDGDRNIGVTEQGFKNLW